MTDTNITIIGAGVVGLAVAAELSKFHKGVMVLEKHKSFGQETSSRNSEVVHSGIYYPEGSLKAKLCVEGRELLYNYCIKHNILFNKCGKLIVATDKKEAEQLPAILKQSQKNGVSDGHFIDKQQAYDMEPNVLAVSALYFPSTGIVDSHGLMKQLETEAVINGAEMAYNNSVVSVTKEDNYYRICVKEDEGDFSFTTNYVINAAGLNSDIISNSTGFINPDYKLHYWKGEYFAIGNGKHKMVSRLVYPVPQLNITGLGVHATIDLNGGLKLGPNTVYLPDKIPEYSVDSSHLKDFMASAGRFLPFLEENDLHPDQSGIRPKLQKPGDPVRDFIIKDEGDNGLPGFINLLGIESPGLTASLAIGKMVSGIISN